MTVYFKDFWLGISKAVLHLLPLPPNHSFPEVSLIYAPWQTVPTHTRIKNPLLFPIAGPFLNRILNLSPCRPLLSQSITFLRFFCTSLLHRPESHSFFLSSIPFYRYTIIYIFIWPLVNIWIVSSKGNKSAINVYMQVLLWAYVFTECNQRKGILINAFNFV